MEKVNATYAEVSTFANVIEGKVNSWQKQVLYDYPEVLFTATLSL